MTSERTLQDVLRELQKAVVAQIVPEVSRRAAGIGEKAWNAALAVSVALIDKAIAEAPDSPPDAYYAAACARLGCGHPRIDHYDGFDCGNETCFCSEFLAAPATLSEKPGLERATASRLFQAEVSEIAWQLGREHPMFDRLMAAVTRHNRTLEAKPLGSTDSEGRETKPGLMWDGVRK